MVYFCNILTDWLYRGSSLYHFRPMLQPNSQTITEKLTGEEMWKNYNKIGKMLLFKLNTHPILYNGIPTEKSDFSHILIISKNLDKRIAKIVTRQQCCEGSKGDGFCYILYDAQRTKRTRMQFAEKVLRQFARKKVLRQFARKGPLSNLTKRAHRHFARKGPLCNLQKRSLRQFARKGPIGNLRRLIWAFNVRL